MLYNVLKTFRHKSAVFTIATRCYRNLSLVWKTCISMSKHAMDHTTINLWLCAVNMFTMSYHISESYLAYNKFCLNLLSGRLYFCNHDREVGVSFTLYERQYQHQCDLDIRWLTTKEHQSTGSDGCLYSFLHQRPSWKWTMLSRVPETYNIPARLESLIILSFEL